MKLIASFLLGASLLVTPAVAKEITIGLAAPLSGPQAYFGGTWHKGFKLYVDKLNAAGGVNGVTVAYDQQDDKADPREGTLGFLPDSVQSPIGDAAEHIHQTGVEQAGNLLVRNGYVIQRPERRHRQRHQPSRCAVVEIGRASCRERV